MKNLATMIAIVGTVVFLGLPAQADWNPGSPAKYVQLPDLNSTGMDVNATWQVLGTVVPPVANPPFVKVLADDFPCTTTGPITDIHIWGSWLNDVENPNTTFHLSIHADVPKDATGTYSHPGSVLWEQDFAPGKYIARPYATAQELFYDPNQDRIIGSDTQVWQYNFLIPEALAFVQKGTAADPVTYWLDVQAVVPAVPGTVSAVFGWKTSLTHWNDDATFADTTLPLSMGGVLNGPLTAPPFWKDMRYPIDHPFAGQSIDMSFVITTIPEPGTFALLGCGLVGLLCYAWRKRK